MISCRSLYRAASQPRDAGASTASEKNPYLFRINEIRDTVTKGKRLPFVAYRLRKCLTRNTYCQWHMAISVLLAILLGILFYKLPSTRIGIEKRENLFRILVSLWIVHDIVCDLYVSGNLVQYLQHI